MLRGRASAGKEGTMRLCNVRSWYRSAQKPMRYAPETTGKLSAYVTRLHDIPMMQARVTGRAHVSARNSVTSSEKTKPAETVCFGVSKSMVEIKLSQTEGLLQSDDCASFSFSGRRGSRSAKV